MLRFIKHNLTSISDVQIYPIFTLVLFTLFFAIVVYRVVKMAKDEVSEISDIPFQDAVTGQSNEI
ncbi:MAG: hypothetical protein RL264_548 [Bacteroidota bacterium]|jgi:Ca2+/Na+ antiporter